jgi:UDP-glucose 4-epimerase
MAQPARALVTGGAGFIGSHLTDYLIEELAFDVVVLDDLSGGFRANVHPKATFVEGSIVDSPLVNELFRERRFDYVYHLAAYAAEGLSHFIKRFNYTNNLIGSVNLINASVNHDARCFVFTSSIAVYGTNRVPLTEDLVPMPEDSYGIAKFAVEQELRISRELFGLDYVIFRPHNVYGERQNLADKYRNVIGIFMNRIMQGEDLIIFGDGEQRRAFTYVKDVIPAIATAVSSCDAYGEVFNVGASCDTSVNDLASRVALAMNASPRLRHVERRQEVTLAYSDHSKLGRFFPTVPETSLDEGLARMARWAKRTTPRKSADFDEIEIAKGLPPVWMTR